MNPERSLAYQDVMQTLRDVGPSKLQPEEQERIRQAADALIFCSALTDQEARDALADVAALCAKLVSSGRWELVATAKLADRLKQCGPGYAAALTAA